MKPIHAQSIARFAELIMAGEKVMRSAKVSLSPRTRVLESHPGMRANILGYALIGHAQNVSTSYRTVFARAYGDFVNFRDLVSETDPVEIKEYVAVGHLLGMPAEILCDLHKQAERYTCASRFAQFIRSGDYEPNEYPAVREIDAVEQRRLALKK